MKPLEEIKNDEMLLFAQAYGNLKQYIKYGDLIHVTVGFLVLDIMTSEGLVLERLRRNKIQTTNTVDVFADGSAYIEMETDECKYSLRVGASEYAILTRILKGVDGR